MTHAKTDRSDSERLMDTLFPLAAITLAVMMSLLFSKTLLSERMLT